MLTIEQARVQFARRSRQVRQLWALEGPRGISERICRIAAERISPKNTLMPVRRADVIEADLSQPFEPPIPRFGPYKPISLNWVIIPPGPRSGGHTTLFRIIRYLEAHGYVNRIYFYNVYG